MIIVVGAIAAYLGIYLLLLHPIQDRTPGGLQRFYSYSLLLVFIPLIVWRVSSRFRRMFGRQRLSKLRPWITLAIYPTLIVMLSFTARSHPEWLWWLAGSLALGWLLGLFGLSKTHFEPTPKGLFYTPHAHIGMVLLLLFVARIFYRLIEVYALETSGPQGPDDFTYSPLTLGVFGLLAGYYISYAIGLIRWRFRVLRAKRQREALRVDKIDV